VYYTGSNEPIQVFMPPKKFEWPDNTFNAFFYYGTLPVPYSVSELGSVPGTYMNSDVFMFIVWSEYGFL
jgi:hypothetical protein